MKKFLSVILLVLFLMPFSAAADESTDFAQALFMQAAQLVASSKEQCSNLSRNNKTLLASISDLSKKAKEHRNTASNIFADADYLLSFLQERITETCGQINIANNEAIQIIIANEFPILSEKRKKSSGFAEFIGEIYDTEYGKLLYLATSVSSLEKMYLNWAAKMTVERSDMKKMIGNISAANIELRDKLIDFTKTYKFYYEGSFPKKP